MCSNKLIKLLILNIFALEPLLFSYELIASLLRERLIDVFKIKLKLKNQFHDFFSRIVSVAGGTFESSSSVDRQSFH